MAELVADRLRGQVGEAAGYLNAEAAGRYICVSRRRIHELTSTGALVPDGYDGRTPLYLRQTLDDYVRGSDRAMTEGAGKAHENGDHEASRVAAGAHRPVNVLSVNKQRGGTACSGPPPAHEVMTQ